MNIRTKLFVLIGFFASIFPTCNSIHGQVSVKAKLDSVSILMGKQTALHYQVVQNKNQKGYFIQENPELIAPNVEIIGKAKEDTTDLGNNRIQIDRTLIIQSFDSGIWEIPAAKYVIGKDTFQSNSLNLKVTPVLVDSMKTINGYKPVEAPPIFLTDYIPDFIYYYWWVFYLILALIAVTVFIWMRKKKGKPLLAIKRKEIPPYDEAVDALNHLKADKLWQNGREKEYFTQLTDILRKYIDRRFQINAIEMTSSQIIETLKKNDETKAVKEQLAQILDIADFVKFANVRPLPDDSEAAWNKAITFVEETKPVENPTTTELQPSTENNKKIK